jgi:hypothetical protein
MYKALDEIPSAGGEKVFLVSRMDITHTHRFMFINGQGRIFQKDV